MINNQRGLALPGKQFATVFIFLDTDKHASPFDILTINDVLPGVTMLKYENVTAEDAEQVVYDAMFPRGPEGAKYTKIFIDGRDFERTNEILERIRKCMFPPFELAVIIDPRGAYTTASAAVAKTLEHSLRRGIGGLEGKKVVVLAGTGPVGQTAARLYASEKSNVAVTSRSLQKASALAAKMNEEFKSERVCGVGAQTSEEVGKAIEGADIILSAGAAGAEILSLEVLEKYGKNCRVVTDINAIPPFGVGGLESDADGKEILSGISGVGALAVGKLKNRVAAELIRRAAEQPKGMFDYRVAFEIAKKMVTEKPEKRRTEEAEPQKYWLP
jgi:hypothetical protein